MHRGTLTSQIDTKLGNRRVEQAFFAAELWEATAGEPAEGVRRPIAEIWPDVLTQQFHDILPGSSIAWVHRDAEATFHGALTELRQHIDAHVTSLAPRGVGVQNPSGVGFGGVHVVTARDVIGGGAARDEPGGRFRSLAESLSDLPHQALGPSACAVAFDVPAFGAVTLQPRRSTDRVVVTDCSMTNGRLSVRWDQHGELTSIIDIATGRELIPIGARSAVLELGRDQPVEYDAWDLESWTREQSRPVAGGDVSIEAEGPLVGRVRVERRFGPSRAVVTYELRAESRQLDVDIDLDWHHDEHLLSLAFPIDVRADTAACDVQFGVAHRPTHPSSPWDAAKFEVCAHRFVTVSEPSFGVAIMNDGRYGHAIFDGAIRVSLARAACYPDPHADRGRHRVRLAVRPHDGDLGDVRAAAELLNRPLSFTVNESTVDDSSDHRVDGPPIMSIVGGDGQPALGVEVDALKLADDGSGDLIVRLHEAVGDRTRITLTARSRIGAAWFCDLMETPTRGEEVGDGVVTVTLRPFQLVTLRLRLVADFDGRAVLTWPDQLPTAAAAPGAAHQG
jgi:alpha-mannosidase